MKRDRGRSTWSCSSARASATSSAARRSPAWPKLDKKTELARADRRHPRARRPGRRPATRASSSTSSGCSTGRGAAELAGVRGELEKLATAAQAAGHRGRSASSR